ncbi:intradiol ring-cleavage dioxygenase [Algoriphagus sp. Y33]|uniref:dioxygenase family protein n=1 Tax=Algoriphagus sp. Y33 TaxID=2772483 RepID=UPI00177F9597|nr:intradiol ring-cleavage dioxygenase [Algoriphagus sp. Y33]
MEKREFLKRLSLGSFALPLLMGCNSIDDPNEEVSGVDSEDTSAACQLTNSETAGPFPTKNPSSLTRVDITSDRTGIPLDLEITVLDASQSCLPLAAAIVDVWHCDKDGNYSEYGGTGMQSADYTAVSFLRGRQTTDSNGKVAFTSIFPGWYTGRATHVHVHIYNASGNSLLVTQIAFPEGSESAVNVVNASSENGYTKGMNGYTVNSRDNVFSDGVTNEMANISGSVDSGFNLTHTIVVKA